MKRHWLRDQELSNVIQSIKTDINGLNGTAVYIKVRGSRRTMTV